MLLLGGIMLALWFALYRKVAAAASARITALEISLRFMPAVVLSLIAVRSFQQRSIVDVPELMPPRWTILAVGAVISLIGGLWAGGNVRAFAERTIETIRTRDLLWKAAVGTGLVTICLAFALTTDNHPLNSIPWFFVALGVIHGMWSGLFGSSNTQASGALPVSLLACSLCGSRLPTRGASTHA